MNLEGGLGADFFGGGLTTGLAYYGTFKLTGLTGESSRRCSTDTHRKKARGRLAACTPFTFHDCGRCHFVVKR